eukprot:11707197-Ditylum_brightwellii.AAC.1
MSISMICGGLEGFATKILNTWKASYWMDLLLSRSNVMIRTRLLGLTMYFIITSWFAFSIRICPRSFKDCRLVT